MLDNKHNLSIRKQCQYLRINRSSVYFKKVFNLAEEHLIKQIEEIYEEYPIYGYRRISAILKNKGMIINQKRVLRLMRKQQLRAIYPGANTSKRNHQEMVYPYLLKNLDITKAHQVWQIDITYIRTKKGMLYLTGIIDVFSRVIVSYRVSNSLSTESCILALEDALSKYGTPEIVNSDQGSQFTSSEWLKYLQEKAIKVSMTGKGRSNDNGYIERLWRTLKYEGIYLHNLHNLRNVIELKTQIGKLIEWYNNERPHQSLNYCTPVSVCDKINILSI